MIFARESEKDSDQIVHFRAFLFLPCLRPKSLQVSVKWFSTVWDFKIVWSENNWKQLSIPFSRTANRIVRRFSLQGVNNHDLSIRMNQILPTGIAKFVCFYECGSWGSILHLCWVAFPDLCQKWECQGRLGTLQVASSFPFRSGLGAMESSGSHLVSRQFLWNGRFSRCHNEGPTTWFDWSFRMLEAFCITEVIHI